MKATVSRNELLAALLFASTDESRYTLNGVCIELRPMNKPTIVATDGRRLVVIETVAEQTEESSGTHRILMRADFAKPLCALCKALGGKLFPWIDIENKAGSARVSTRIVGAECYIEAEKNGLIEGEFPEWRKVLPPRNKAKREPISDVAMNAGFMADFAKAAKILEAPGPIMQMSLAGKEQQIEVKIPGLDGFYGLIMQCKLDESLEYQPEFVQIVKGLPVREAPAEPDTDVEN